MRRVLSVEVSIMVRTNKVDRAERLDMETDETMEQFIERVRASIIANVED